MPDSQPNYLITAADGSVEAVFPGGVIIEAQPGAASLLTPNHGITWTNGPSGAKVAEVYAAQDPAYPPGIAPQMYNRVYEAGNPLRFAELALIASTNDDQVKATAGGKSVNVIRSDGSSSFVRGANATLVAGWFNGYGAVGGQVNTYDIVGPQITVTKSAVGVWSFDLRPIGFTKAPAFACMMAGGNGPINTTGTPAGGIVIKMQDSATPNQNFLQLLAYNTQTWATADISFLFAMVGPTA